MKNESEFSIRLNQKMKEKCVALCNKNCITMTELIKAFIESTCLENKLPFERKDISNDIVKNYESVKLHIRFNDVEMLDRFKEICTRNSLSYSLAIKTYINLCIKKNAVLCKKRKKSKLYNNRQFTRFDKVGSGDENK